MALLKSSTEEDIHIPPGAVHILLQLIVIILRNDNISLII